MSPDFFGCEAFVEILKEHRIKLENKSMKCIYLGYANDEFGYCLLDLVNFKGFKSRDSIFNKLEMFKLSIGDK